MVASGAGDGFWGAATEEVAACGEDMRRTSEELRTIADRLGTLWRLIHNQRWRGHDADAFGEHLQQWARTLQGAGEKVGQRGEQLRAHAQAQDAASSPSGGGSSASDGATAVDAGLGLGIRTGMTGPGTPGADAPGAQALDAEAPGAQTHDAQALGAQASGAQAGGAGSGAAPADDPGQAGQVFRGDPEQLARLWEGATGREPLLPTPGSSPRWDTDPEGALADSVLN